jgi:lantibiotic biosynthesis protein
MSWRPVLEGEDRARALATVRQIADAVRTHPADPRDSGLAGGEAGLAMLFGYLHEWDGSAGYAESGEQRLEKAIDAVAEQPMGASLYSGFTGIAWATEHLVPSGPDEEDANEQIDEALAEHLTLSPWSADYDLIVGLTGFGLYAVDRLASGLPRPHARTCAERTLARLEEIAHEKDGGLTWWTPPHLLIPETRERYPNGYYNLGVAHGMPATLTLLALLNEQGVESARTTRLLEGAFRWMTANRLPDGLGSRYGYNTSEQPGDSVHSRLAWCYGDIGIAAALLWAARSPGAGALAPALEAEAIATAQASAARAPEGCGVVDAGVCHGAAGLALLFARLYNATLDERYRERAVQWARGTLGLQKEGVGIAGYQAWGPIPGEGMKLGWTDDVGFLTGTAGIGLTLLGLATELEPKWDRMLMTSVPPR